MNMLDYGLVTLLYEDRLREAERKRRFLYLTLDMDNRAPLEGAKGLMQQIRLWLSARAQRRTAKDVRRPRAV